MDFRLASFPFSAANLDPAFGMGACPARSRALGSKAHRSTAQCLTPPTFACKFLFKAEFREHIKYLGGKSCPLTDHFSSEPQASPPAVSV